MAEEVGRRVLWANVEPQSCSHCRLQELCHPEPYQHELLKAPLIRNCREKTRMIQTQIGLVVSWLGRNHLGPFAKDFEVELQKHKSSSHGDAARKMPPS